MFYTTQRLQRYLAPALLLVTLLLAAGSQEASVAAADAAAGADTPLPAGTVQKMELSDITVLSLVDSPHTFQAFEFPDLDNYPERKALVPGGKFPALIKTYLIKTAGHTVLVDSGMGKECGVDGQTLEMLLAQGVQAHDVTDILLTHMDIDHVAGLIHNGQAVYPRAILRISRAEHKAWTAGAVGRPAGQIALGQRVAEAYKGRTELFDFGVEVVPGITALEAGGHTAGHTVYDITSGDKGLTIVGDLMHVHAIQLRHTDYCTIYDDDPAQAAAARERTLARLSAGDRIMAGMHFPMVGKVRPARGGGYTVDQE